MRTHIIVATAVICLASAALAEDPYVVEWISQIGSSDVDVSRSVDVDASGNIYISGWTRGDLGGPVGGYEDAFLSKFGSAGNHLWTKQIGTDDGDRSCDVAADAAGNVYIGGNTSGALGGPSAGYEDAFLGKFDADGNEIWLKQIGTTSPDTSYAVAVDACGNAYISGRTTGDLGGPNAGQGDAFVCKFDSGGNEVWSAQIGTPSGDGSCAVAVDAYANVYITGHTFGDLGGPHAGLMDVYLSKFDSGGNQVWTTQIGTQHDDESTSVAVDGYGNTYVSGFTRGDLGGTNAGYTDLFLSKFGPDGNVVWTTQIGSDTYDGGFSVAVDAAGNPYVSGKSDGDLGGPNAGNYDVLLGKFDSDGNLIWMTQTGTSNAENGQGIALDAAGNVYISGETGDDLGGPSAGALDAYVMKYEIPEPATMCLLAIGGVGMLRRKRLRSL